GPPLSRSASAAASRVAGSSPARPATSASASRTGASSRPSVVRMSAWIAGSSAPGTRYSALSGIITPARARRSSLAVLVSGIGASVEQIGEALLDLVGDVERQRLDCRGRVHAAGRDEEAAVDDEQVLHIMRPAPAI